MQALRRAIGRKDVIFALAVFLVAGGWFGWHQLIRPVLAQVAGTSSLKDLLDAGQFAQVISQADTMLAVHTAQPQVLRYRAIAQHLTGPSAGALQTVEAAPSAGASEADLSVLLAVKALELAGYDYQQIPEAKQAAAQALGLAGGDADAGLLARVACAAAQRCEMDDPGQAPNLSQHVAQIARVLEPLYAAGATEPQAVWASRLWQRGLALMADTQMLAGAAGDPTGEPAALALLKRLCPQDAWACYFNIPAKALATVQSGTLDDHARAAMLTATGFLYAKEGDRLHCDACFRKAIQAYGRLLEDYEGWAGDQGQTVTPKGKLKTVGKEFYDYRNRLERLAKYGGDWWGIRVARGEVTLENALAACDYRIFRALVRLKADRQTNPVLIAMQERLRPDFIQTLAAWLERNPYEPQAAWEKERATVLKQVADEQIAIKGVFQQLSAFYGPQVPLDLAGAEGVLREALATEPVLLASRVQLRSRLADILMRQKRYTEVLALLDANDQDLQQGDPYLGTTCPCDTFQLVRYRYQALLGNGQRAEAIAFAESLAANATQTDDARLTMMEELAMAYLPDQIDAAAEVYARMQNYVVKDPQCESLRQTLLEIVARALEQVRRMDRAQP